MIQRQHIHKVVLRLPDSWSNWNLEMLVFEERGKPEYPEKNLSEQRRKPTTNSTHIWRRRRDLNPGHTGWRRALSPLCHLLLPKTVIVRSKIQMLGMLLKVVHGQEKKHTIKESNGSMKLILTTGCAVVLIFIRVCLHKLQQDKYLTLQLLHLCVESCGVTTQINSPWQNSYMVLHVPTSLDFYRKDNWNFCNF